MRQIRGLELRTYGNFVRLPRDLTVQTSVDGVTWTPAFDDRPGGLALAASLASPIVVPLRIDLSDVAARYVRINTPAFRLAQVTIFEP